MKLEVQKLAVSRAEKISDQLHLFLHSNTNNESYYDVDFDNLRIAHKRNIVLEVNTYYPYGMLNTSLSWRLTNNQYKYQGKAYLNQLNYNVLDFGARMGACPDRSVGNPAIARFTTPDPIMQYNNGYFAMGGNPVSMIDPTGMKSFTSNAGAVESEPPPPTGGGSFVDGDHMPGPNMYGIGADNQSNTEFFETSIMQLGINSTSQWYGNGIYFKKVDIISQPQTSQGPTSDQTFKIGEAVVPLDYFTNANAQIASYKLDGMGYETAFDSEYELGSKNNEGLESLHHGSHLGHVILDGIEMSFHHDANYVFKYAERAIINGKSVILSPTAITAEFRASTLAIAKNTGKVARGVGIVNVLLTTAIAFEDDVTVGDFVNIGLTSLNLIPGYGLAYGIIDLGYTMYYHETIGQSVCNCVDRKGGH